MADGGPEELVLERWTLGWNPINQVPDYLYPRELRQGQALEARNVRFTPGGRMEWRRNQFSIDAPTGANVGAVKSLAEFVTEDYNQILALVRYGAGAPYAGRLYYQNVTWDGATPTQTTYGYELFNGGTWTNITTDADAVALLAADGFSAALQVKQYLYIAPKPYSATRKLLSNPLLRWDGATLRIVGLDPPGVEPTASALATGVLSAGTYSYRYTFYDPTSGFESMPSPVEDVHVPADGYLVNLTGITDYGDNYYKRLYRAFTTDTANDARGAEWYLLAELPPGTGAGTQETLTGWSETDTEGRLTVGANSAAYVNLEGDDTVHLSEDQGAGTVTDFEHRFALAYTSGDSGATAVAFGVSDGAAPGVFSAWSNGVGVELVAQSGAALVYLTVRTDAPYAGGAMLSAAIPNGATRYFRLIRQGTTHWLYMYQSSDYSDAPVVCTKTRTDGDTAYRYAYAGCSAGTVATTKMSFTISNVVLDAAASYTDNVPAYGLSQLWSFDRAKPPDGRLLEWHKDRMFMAGCSRGSESYPDDRAYYGNVLFCSALDEPDYWPGDNLFVVGDDTPIVGLASWGEYLVIFKENGVWTLTGYGDTDFRLAQLTSAVGSVNANVHCAAPPGVLWMAPDGYYFWDADRIERVLPLDEQVPWTRPAARDLKPRICFHEGRFYVLQEDAWLEFAPATKTWACHDADYLDAQDDTPGLRAYNRGGAQSHVLTAMAWASSQSPLITVLDQAGPLANYATAGTVYSDYRAPVYLTLGPIEAPVGEELVPLSIHVDGSWTRDVSHLLYVYLTPDPEYSATAGDNAWATTPECPQGDNIIGVPGGYSYVDGTTKYVTNAARRWYVQIGGGSGADFVLDAVRVICLRRRARGA